MKALTTATMLVALLLSSVDPVYAECASPQPGLEDTDAVFSGEVIAIERVRLYDTPEGWAEGDLVTFKVGKAYKGVDTPTVTVEVEMHSETFIFEQGQHYLVYAYDGAYSPAATLATSGCQGNKLLAGPLQATTTGTGNVRLLLAVGSLLVLTISGVFVLRQRRARR